MKRKWYGLYRTAFCCYALSTGMADDIEYAKKRKSQPKLGFIFISW